MAVLTQDTLDHCAARTAEYDRENRFFTEDFEELRDTGYLLLAVPTELGGLGMTLAEVCQEERRLARRSPATALALNMHIYWTGVAADLWRSGDKSLSWILEEAVAGEVFAAGHGEAGNDFPVLLSTARAERVDGGYKIHAHKIFGSLTPVWTRLGVHAMDTSDPANPKVVHAFLPRNTPDWHVVETWDTLGMRATRSDDTVIDGAVIPDRYVARVVPAGLAGADEFVLGIFAWAEPTFASMYLGLAERALELAVAGAKRRTSIGLGGRALAYHPMIQHTIAEMAMELETSPPTSNVSPRTGRRGSITGCSGRPSWSEPSSGPSRGPSGLSTWPWTSRAGRGCSNPTSSSACIGTFVVAASTPPTAPWPTRS